MTTAYAATANASRCPSLAHGRRLVGAELDDFLDEIASDFGTAIRSGVWSVRFGVNDYVISFADDADQRSSCDDRSIMAALALLVRERHELDVDPPAALAVWLALRSTRAKDDPTHADLARLAGLSIARTGRALQSLRRVGLVDWHHQTVADRQVANSYMVHKAPTDTASATPEQRAPREVASDVGTTR